MAKTLTRAELFEKVWSMPMTKAAAELGLSDVGLKKVCDRYRVPVPGRGYWAKVAAGKPVKKAHFREVSDDELNTVRIAGGVGANLPEAVKEVRSAAKEREKRPENIVHVVPVYNDLPPKIARTRKNLEKRPDATTGFVSSSSPDAFSVSIAQASVDRAVNFLAALLRGVEDRGYTVTKGGKALVFVVDGEVLSFHLQEEHKRVPHEVTEEEREALRKWEVKRSRHWEYVPRPKQPEWDYHATGRLRAVINGDTYSYNNLRRSFGDGKIQRIESQVNAILESFATWSAWLKAKRIQDEQRKREYEAEQKRRAEMQRREALESKRVAALDEIMAQWEKCERANRLISIVEERFRKGTFEDPEKISEWLNWAKAHVSQIDPFKEGLPRLLQFEDFDEWELRRVY